MKKEATQLRFGSVEEFWKLLAGVELAFVLFETPSASGQNFLEALGEIGVDEHCYTVDATLLRGRCHDYFLVHSPLAKRIAPEWEGRIPLPFMQAVIPGVAIVSAAYEPGEIPRMLQKARKETLIFRRAKEQMTQPSLRAMQVLAAIGIEAYRRRNGVNDPELESYIKHLWKITSTTDLPDWSGECTRLCDRLVARLALEKNEHLRHLCNAAHEITELQMYTTFKPDRAARFLHDVSDLSEVRLESLAASELFCRHVAGPDGWGEPVPQSLAQEWKHLAQQIA